MTTTESHPAQLVGARPTLPTLPRTFVARPRLWAALDEAVRGAVTTVTAPAGAGKTMGVAGWLHHGRAARDITGPLPPLWFSDAGAISPERLRAVIEDAARGPHDHEGPGTRGRGRLVVLDNAERLSAGCVAVLDDALDRPSEHMHVLLLSRWDVPLRRLVPQLLGTLTDIRGEVLRMDEDEASRLVRLHAPACPDEVVESVVTEGRGWCAALVLAARSVRARATRSTSPSSASAGARAGDLLAHEVFAALSPRERHLLLSVCHEGPVTAAEASLLANDAGALEVLEGLEATGLLVERETAPEGVDDEPSFRVHPLLLDVVRRRFRTGGVDVQRARATIARSGEVELARGELGRAFDRAWVGAGPEGATRMLAEHGLLMVLRGEHARVTDATVNAGRWLRDDPAASLAAAVERWLADDARGVARWLEPATAARADGGGVSPVDLAVAGLLSAHLGLQPVAPAVAAGLAAVDVAGARETAGRRSLLLTLVGTSQNWLGDLRAAEINLSAALLSARSEGAAGLEAVALASLALTEFMRGRESGCVDLAAQSTRTAGADAAACASAAVPLRLARTHSDPWGEATEGEVASEAPLTLGPVGTFWSWLVQARALALRGRVAEAQVMLDAPVGGARWPRHLEVVLQTERALLASAGDDPDTLRGAAEALHALGATREELLARGLLEVCRGQLAAAAESFRGATVDGEVSEPDTATLAMVAWAQVTHALGASEEADVLMRRSLARAERHQDALAFVGWSVHATPVHLLLGRLNPLSCSPWALRVREQAVRHGSLASRVSVLAPTAREARAAVSPVSAPTLTGRERDVLLQLARGATYEDIAETLFVSTNTVKTHVASLYAKLGARRRSEALAAARTQRLI